MEEDDDSQVFLNKKTVFDIREKGGENVLHAIFLENLSKEFYSQDKNKNSLISSLKQSEFDVYTWYKALRVSLAVLKRYKMFHTISTIESEFGLLPHRTGFRNGKQLDKYFNELLYNRNAQNQNKKHHHHHHHSKTAQESPMKLANESPKYNEDDTKKRSRKSSKASSHKEKEHNSDDGNNNNNESFNQSDFLFTPGNSPVKTNDATVIDTATADANDNFIHVFHEILSSSGSQKSNSSSQNSLMNAPKLLQEVPVISENDLKEFEEQQALSGSLSSTSSSKKKRRVKIKRNKPKKEPITPILQKGIDLSRKLSSTFDSGDASLTNENTLPLFDTNDSNHAIRRSNEVFSIETLSSVQLQNDSGTHTFDALQNFIDDGEPSLSIDTGEGSPVFRTHTKK